MIATILSMQGPPAIINIEGKDPEIKEIIKHAMEMASPFTALTFHARPYRSEILGLINKCAHKYYLNFEEDHFMAITPNLLGGLFKIAEKYNVDIIRASFNKVEQKSAEDVNCIYEDELCKVFKMDEDNFEKFQKHYPRYYIGTNSIFKTSFANEFYSRIGHRPHDYELSGYSKKFEYICMVPKISILTSIDDDHGEEGTCLLSVPSDKFTKCIKDAKFALGLYTEDEVR